MTTRRGGPQHIPRPDEPGAVLAGGPPPWAYLPEPDRHVDLADLTERVRSFEPGVRNTGQGPVTAESAVLVPLYMADEPTVVLTRRSPHMRSHTHEVAFPGGRRDPQDRDLIATALREANEEIGLDPATVEIIGELDRFVTVGSASMVHPYVAVLDRPPGELVANPDEVEAILHVPLSELLLDEVWREELWDLRYRTTDGDQARAPIEPAKAADLFPITFFELHGDTVWGATGNMLRQLLTIATDPS